MRWPIQIQLLLPMLTVVVLAIALASLGSAYFGACRAREAQEEDLHRVVTTLAEAQFPLTDSVLRQMSGLSGAEFVVLAKHDSPTATTLVLSRDDLERLKTIPVESPLNDSAKRSTLLLGDRVYLGQRVTVNSRDSAAKSGSLVVLYPEDRRAAVMREAAYPALIAGAIAAVAVTLVTTVLAHRFVRPIRQLGDCAAAIARGDFRPVSISRRNDEIQDLAVSINQMSAKLGAYESEVRRHEQLRTLDRLGAGMAHQLRNAATGGRMAIELHQRECVSGRNSESLEVALRQLRLMESYLQRFMALGRDSAAEVKKLSLSEIVEESLSLVRPACIHAGIELEYRRPAESLFIRGDAEALQQLIVNLTMNAVEALGRQGSPNPRIEIVLEQSAENRARLRVCDTGPGPSSEVADRLFEPFVTGKPEGTGLGLYVARQIVESLAGAIHWRRENEKTCFIVDFPLE